MMRWFMLSSWVLLQGLVLGCAAEDSAEHGGGGDGDTDVDGGADGGDGVDTDTDTGADTGEGDFLVVDGVFVPDCGDCPAVGDNLEALRCAADLCDDRVFVTQGYSSPTGSPVQKSYLALEHFGDTTNMLQPLFPEVGGSYALMATGEVLSDVHSDTLGPNGAPDPLYPATEMYDAMEWKVTLKAPPGAHGIRMHYIFFSVEYDEYVGTSYNDKFYIYISGTSEYTDYDRPINLTTCRGDKHDGDCDQQLDAMGICTDGAPFCYIAVNSAFSECCWKNGCPNGTWTTDISGTGFACADRRGQEMTNLLGQWVPGAKSANFGSSTGWLATEWPVEPGEKFDLIFHIHDTADASLDSLAIIDKVVFVGEANPGTAPV